MWHALRAELTYARPYLLGGLGLAVAADLVIHATAGVRSFLLIVAPMVVFFIVHTQRSAERRVLLLLSGSLTPKQIAGVTVLLPTVMLALGIAAALSMLAIGALVSGGVERESVNEALYMVGFVGAQMFAYSQLGLLIQEAFVARGQGRLPATIGGFSVPTLAVGVLLALYVGAVFKMEKWVFVHLSVALVAILATVILYMGRTDFTR